MGVADGVGGIEAGDLGLGRGGGEGFLEFGLFGARVFVGFGGLAVELFGCELVGCVSLESGRGSVRGLEGFNACGI